ncbi:MAG TPA: hypothetical protein VGJ02_03735 [Pyrinomonadaceae bacterium]
MAQAKEETRINVRIRPEIKRELEIAAELNGLTLSSMVNHLVVTKIREEKQKAPEAFENSAGVAQPPRVADKISTDTQIPGWQRRLRKAKGMWKERNDLPDLETLRKEADRSDQWNKD